MGYFLKSRKLILEQNKIEEVLSHEKQLLPHLGPKVETDFRSKQKMCSKKWS